MKGPGYKTALDVRRTWKCPACGTERKLLGDVTTMTCHCRDGGVFMAIVTERIVAPRPYQPLNETDVRSAAFGIEDMPVLLPHPSTIPAPRTPVRKSYGEPPAKVEDQQPSAAIPAATDNSNAAAAPPRPIVTAVAPRSQEPSAAARPAPPSATTEPSFPPTTATASPAVEPVSQPTTPPAAEPEDDWGAGIL